MEEIKMRRSVRNYLDNAVEEEKIIQLLESGRLAPSGSNTQPWRFIVVKSKESKEKLAEVSNQQKWMVSAPVFIVCVADIRSRIKEEVAIEVDENSAEEEVKQIIRDTSIAITQMMLEAVNLGLATCWVAWFTQKEIRPILHIPADKYVVGILTLGYAAENPAARPRKPLEEIVRYERW
ncbi:nitroreductase family protein [Azotosporobacter soli]|uniref:nitroreductase family protein n=1 Tax=Azotosporobacter soli TaxID=3055040 RepID=UPI0031FE5B1A